MWTAVVRVRAQDKFASTIAEPTCAIATCSFGSQELIRSHCRIVDDPEVQAFAAFCTYTSCARATQYAEVVGCTDASRIVDSSTLDKRTEAALHPCHGPAAASAGRWTHAVRMKVH